MQTIAAILLTAAATAGTVRAAKKLRSVLRRRKMTAEGRDGLAGKGPVIDLERDAVTGVYSARRRA
ncbi:hypothetical protein [Parvularcula maris]|uniref:Uncharacterized protein n=1 Tax=Parvularcula maris TaxID=2965077 RepID=A0A9X2L8Y8_9PROT|nr:hypothetical protein [Parvularcula maris]MCQ8185109.1 hypothetical protein [Parvularcula maris]